MTFAIFCDMYHQDEDGSKFTHTWTAYVYWAHIKNKMYANASIMLLKTNL